MFGAALFAIALGAPEPVRAFPVGDTTGPPAGRSIVQIDVSGEGMAEGLATRLPAWEEPISAGTERLVLPNALVAELLAEGWPIESVGQAPADLRAWPACAPRLDDLQAWLRSYALEHPDLVEVIDIGDSHCKSVGGCTTAGGEVVPGDDLLFARVTRRGAGPEKSGKLWVDAGLHARELATYAVARGLVEYLVEGYGADPQLTWLLDHREVYVGIASNPDGTRLVELGASGHYGGEPWYWRKNARSVDAACAWPPSMTEHSGVDLNRNHAFKWDAPGHSRDKCAQTYRGSAPASETEIRAYEAYARGLFPSRRGPGDADAADPDAMGVLINLHSYTSSGTVLVPWGWTAARTADDAALVALAERYIAGNGYARQYSLYPVSGNTRDWGYGELGIPAYVVELAGADFFPTCAEVDAALSANIPPLIELLALADKPYHRIRGPEVVELTATEPRPGAPELTLRAVLDERRAGRDRVAGAEVLVGLAGGVGPTWPLPPPGAPEGTGMGLSPADGRFDSVREVALGDIDVSGLAPGPHYAVVRARDARGMWGPSRAVGFIVAADVTPEPSASSTAVREPPSPSSTPTSTATPTPTATITTTASATSTPSATATAPQASPSSPSSTHTPSSTPPAPTATSRPAYLPWSRR